MANEQGIATQLKIVKQVSRGTAVTAGSRLLRRRTGVFNKTGETYENDEIVSHQMSTGATEGPTAGTGALAALASAGTYSDLFAALLRRDFTAITPITALSVTIAGAGPTYTITRSSGWLTDGIKIGHVFRITVGTLNAANIAKNLLVIGLTQTVATVIPLNGVALVAEGPITGCTVTVIGKTTYTPLTGHTNDYFTVEKWFPSVPASEVYVDTKVASAAITIPGTGNTTIDFDMPSLSRTEGASEVLTTPTAESTSLVLAAKEGKIAIGSTITAVTGLTINITGNISQGDAEVGTSSRSDHQRGDVAVTVSFTAKFSATTLQTIRSNQSVTNIIASIADSALATAEFMVISIPAVKLMSDDSDDGKKEIVRTYNGTAQYYGAGGAAVAHNATILQIQDSLAA